MSMPAVSKHLRVLERAGLIARGREAQWRPCRIEAAPLKEVAEWTERYRQIWEQRLDRLELYLQQLKAKEKTTWSASGVANSETFKVTTPSDREIHLTRLFDAPRAPRVRGDDASPSTSSGGGAASATAIRCRCARSICASAARGASSIATRRASAEFYGVYREITPPGRIVFTEIFAPFPDAESVVTADAHRRERQDAADRDVGVSVERSARHGAQHRNGEGRRHQLRPPRGTRGANCSAPNNCADGLRSRRWPESRVSSPSWPSRSFTPFKASC